MIWLGKWNLPLYPLIFRRSFTFQNFLKSICSTMYYRICLWYHCKKFQTTVDGNNNDAPHRRL